jgi:hypothetical protein
VEGAASDTAWILLFLVATTMMIKLMIYFDEFRPVFLLKKNSPLMSGKSCEHIFPYSIFI